VATQDIDHSGVLHPIKAFLGVHLSVPSSSNESITLKPSASHEDEDAEGRVAKAEALWQNLAVRSDEGVDLVDLALVHFAESGGELFVAACEFFEGLGNAHPKQAAECRVTRDASLTVSQDIDGAHVSNLAIGCLETLHHHGVVVVRDSARIVDTERVEGVGEGCPGSDGVERLVENDLFGRDGALVFPASGTEKSDVV